MAKAPTRRAIDYLGNALEAAEGELTERFHRLDFLGVAMKAQDIVEYAVGIAVPSPDSHLVGADPEERLLGGFDVERIRESALTLPRDLQLWPPWVRFAVELILMERAIDRLQEMTGRYADLRAVLVDRRVPDRIDENLKEIVNLYLWGFDGAVVGMACACFETIARKTLVALGKFTERQLEREHRGAEQLRNDLKNAGVLDDGLEEVKYLVRQRNAVLHGKPLDGPLLGVSRQCVATLGKVIRQLHPSLA